VALEGLDLSAGERAKISAHLQYVENLLKSIECKEKKETRELNISNLHRYWNQGIFPEGEHCHESVARKPNFCDSNGNLCAVGYLIQNSTYGGSELVGRVMQCHQFSYLNDMALPELAAWQEKSGLSFEELAMIQPTYEFYCMERVKNMVTFVENL